MGQGLGWRGNICTSHRATTLFPFSAPRNNSSISKPGSNTYVTNVHGAACSTCVSVFLASHYVSSTPRPRPELVQATEKATGRKNGEHVCFEITFASHTRCGRAEYVLTFFFPFRAAVRKYDSFQGPTARALEREKKT